ncbi:hypothetical protein [Moorena sp. SIO2C4]|uniref:hypothetical protein n=1 Tax=Moorena sp. SIO2C4 TaxID=2607824 RepID=UPI0013C735AB|nr:hypothetical protein [Moorena sp. SIO2C4]NES44838.1 hypothetical protein [Moorena sp. SIO2C4]
MSGSTYSHLLPPGNTVKVRSGLVLIVNNRPDSSKTMASLTREFRGYRMKR